MELNKTVPVGLSKDSSTEKERKFIQLCGDEEADKVGGLEVGTWVPPCGWDYEVFLSFRGPDTRTGFTDFLYEFLTGAGVRTYRDEEELRKGGEIGPELLKAIEQTKIFIPIFSKNYAASKWCLAEVAQMVKCRKKQLILPVFYHVQPSDVRRQRGCYEDAFCKHESKFPDNIVQGWRNALSTVGSIVGWCVHKNRGEGSIIREVLKRVKQVLKMDRLQVPDYLVGINEHVENILNLLNPSSNDVKVLGIFGMGGIGKTTLAKVLYNHLSDNYDSCCFISDVRETSSHHKGLESLQGQLISKILKTECGLISNVDEGLGMMKGRFYNKKVLIFLDDVDHRNQLDALAVKPEWFGQGSRIIVTTRNQLIFDSFKEVLIAYECRGLDSQQSLQLFSKHARLANSPPEEFLALSREIVSTSAGLPLVLEVVGSLLVNNESEKFWSDTVEKLKYTSDKQVQEKLKISYETLEYGQKQIFLDIACFFDGMDKMLPFYMWRDCKFFPENGIHILCSKCLLKVENGNILRMHDQLRDLGRGIVREENNNEPGERSRLWCSEEAFDVLERKAGTKNVLALTLELHDSDVNSFTDVEFRTLPDLRFLHVNDGILIGDFNLPKLRWLVYSSRLCAISANFHVKNLVIFDLSSSLVTKNWSGWNQIQILKKLKVLNLSYCHDLVGIPDVSRLVNLERLILQGCSGLVEIDPSIKQLERLVLLDLRDCMALKEMPADLGPMGSLEELLIRDTMLGSIPLVASMKKLKVLKATYCRSLTEVTSSIGSLTSLTKISFNGSPIIKLPDSIGSSENLQILSLSSCDSLMELPESIGRLTSLTKLLLESPRITELPDSIGNMKALRVLSVSCRSITRLPTSIGMLERLEEMNISHCDSLEGDIPFDISRLTSLKVLCFTYTGISGLPTGIPSLSCLEVLETTSSKQLQSLPELPSSVRHLSITCHSGETVPNLANLTKLESLSYVDCSNMVEILGTLQKLTKLKSLSFTTTSIRTLPDSTWALSQLEYLKFTRCASLQSLPLLPSSLKKISLMRCESLVTLPDISNLKHLSRLALDCASLVTIPNISILKHLSHLNLAGEKLVSVDVVGELEFLVHLRICSRSLERLPNLSKLKKLITLSIQECDKLVEIPGIEGLESLVYLDALGCENLRNLDGLDQLINLEIVIIYGCKSLTRRPTLRPGTNVFG